MISRIVIALLVLHAVWVEFEIHGIIFPDDRDLRMQDIKFGELINLVEDRLNKKIDNNYSTLDASLESLGEVVMPGSKERIKKIKEDTLRDLMKSGGK